MPVPPGAAWHHLAARQGHKQSPGRTLPTAACSHLHSRPCGEVGAGSALPLDHLPKPHLVCTEPFPLSLNAAQVLCQAHRAPVPLPASSDILCKSFKASHPQDNSSWSQVFDTFSVWMHLKRVCVASFCELLLLALSICFCTGMT